MGATTPPSEAVKQIHFLGAALKAPRITESAGRLADQARDAGWTHEDYLAAVLERTSSPPSLVIACHGTMISGWLTRHRSNVAAPGKR